jgi:transcriptional regulator with XRE-family HTH domain
MSPSEIPLINRALKQIRLFHNLNQQKCGQKLGISQVTVSQIESGTLNISLSMIQRYADTFNLPCDQILFFSKNMDMDAKKRDRFKEFVSEKIIQILEFISFHADKDNFLVSEEKVSTNLVQPPANKQIFQVPDFDSEINSEITKNKK